MTRNLGSIDRGIRTVLGVGLAGYGVAAGNWWGLLGVGLLVNAAMGVCFAYRLFGLSTCRRG